MADDADAGAGATAASQASTFSYGNLSFTTSQPGGGGGGQKKKKKARHGEHGEDRGTCGRDPARGQRGGDAAGAKENLGAANENDSEEEEEEEEEEEKPRKGRKVRKSHVFWAARANAAISTDFCLKMSSQEVNAMGQANKLGLRKDFRPPRQVPVAETRDNARAAAKAQLEGTIFEAPAPRVGAEDEAAREARYVQSTLAFEPPKKRARTSRCFDVVVSKDSSVDGLEGVEPERSADGIAADLEAQNQRRNPFEAGPWRMVQRRFPSALEEFSVRAILENRLGNARKVPALAVVVLKTHYLEEGAMCVIADPTGEIESEVHPKVLSSDEYDFVEGCAVVLKDFTVFRAHLNREEYASHSVIITPRNIERVFGVNERTDTQDDPGVPASRADTVADQDVGNDDADDADLVGWLSGNAAEAEQTAQRPVQLEPSSANIARMKHFEALLASQEGESEASTTSAPANTRTEHAAGKSGNDKEKPFETPLAPQKSEETSLAASTAHSRTKENDARSPGKTIVSSQANDSVSSQCTVAPAVGHKTNRAAETSGSGMIDARAAGSSADVADSNERMRELEAFLASHEEEESAAASPNRTPGGETASPIPKAPSQDPGGEAASKETTTAAPARFSQTSAHSQHDELEKAFASQAAAPKPSASQASTFNDDRWLDDADDDDLDNAFL